MRLLRQFAAFFLPATTVLAGREPVYVYVDEWSYSGQAVADELVRMAEAGVSHIILAFHLIDNPSFPDEIADSVLAWSQLDSQLRADTLNKLHALGTRLIISSGGESEGAAWMNHDGAEFAAKACALVRDLGADGFDFDKEGFGFMTQAISDWNDAAVKKCREVWPGVLITSAPQSPHFSTAMPQKYSDGLKTGNGMDHYLIQAYNQGTWTMDTTYEGLFISSGGMAIKELMNNYPGVGNDVFVVGKPYATNDAGSGHLDHATLRQFICKAYTDINYRGGVMFWKHPWGKDLSDFKMLAQPCDGSAFTQDPIGGGTTGAPTTAAPTTAATTRATTTPATTKAQTTTSATTRANPTTANTTPSSTDASASSSGDMVETCQTYVTSPDPSWEASCEHACELYATTYAQYCPGATDASDLITCVIKQQSKCTLGCI